MSIHAVRERERERERERKSGGFLKCKSIAYIALELVDKVHKLEVGMGSYGVSEVGTRAGE